MRRYCLQPHCSRMVTKGYCHAHAKAHDQDTRGTAHARGYTYQWSLYSKARLARLPICGMREDGSLDPVHSRCAQEHRTTRAECTDHIVPLRHGGDMWNPENHLSLCLACNTWKASTLERRTA